MKLFVRSKKHVDGVSAEMAWLQAPLVRSRLFTPKSAARLAAEIGPHEYEAVCTELVLLLEEGLLDVVDG